jgi:hypothetical protein
VVPQLPVLHNQHHPLRERSLERWIALLLALLPFYLYF